MRRVSFIQQNVHRAASKRCSPASLRQFLAGVSLFLLGITCSPGPSGQFVQNPLHELAPKPLPGSAAAAEAAAGNATNSNATEPAPAGLRMMRQYAHNPWSASVKLITAADLDRSVPLRKENRTRVVVSLTSLPKRLLKHAASTISMLKRQTLQPDRIYVNIPSSPLRGAGPYFGENGRVPQWMADDPQIRVLRPARDLGPATKLLPTLEAERSRPDTIIVTIDDDNEGGWTDSTLLGIVAHALHFPDFAVGLTGWNVTCALEGAHCGSEDTGLPEKKYNLNDLHMIRQASDYACHVRHLACCRPVKTRSPHLLGRFVHTQTNCGFVLESCDRQCTPGFKVGTIIAWGPF